MGKARSKTSPGSAKKRKLKFKRQNETLVAEDGMTMDARASQARYKALVQREDVAGLKRSRDTSQKAAAVARSSKNKAMAEKRSAEKGQAAALRAAAAADESKVAAEAATLAAKKKLEEERRSIQRLQEQLSRLALEKGELDQRYREVAKECRDLVGAAGEREQQQETPVSPSTLPLEKQVIAAAMMTEQRKRELDTGRALVKANENLRKQVGEGGGRLGRER